MKRRQIILLFILFPTILLGQSAQVCISHFDKDSSRVEAGEIVEDPVIRICGVKNAKIISYALTLNINGVLYSWTELHKDSLSKENILKLYEIRNSLPKYNQLFIEYVKYLDTDKIIKTAKPLYLWLAIGTDCKGTYNIKTEKYKNDWRQIKSERFYCNDTCIKIKNYGMDGKLSSIKEYYFNPDKLVITNLYHKTKRSTSLEIELNDKNDGTYYIYYPNGTLKLVATNFNGVRLNEKLYDKNKHLELEIKCDSAGKNCELTNFDADGQIKKIKQFKYKGTKHKWMIQTRY